MYPWVKFVVFGIAGLISGIYLIYYLIAKRDKITNVKTWKLLLACFALFGFLAERYYQAIFE